MKVHICSQAIKFAFYWVEIYYRDQRSHRDRRIVRFDAFTDDLTDKLEELQAYHEKRPISDFYAVLHDFTICCTDIRTIYANDIKNSVPQSQTSCDI